MTYRLTSEDEAYFQSLKRAAPNKQHSISKMQRVVESRSSSNRSSLHSSGRTANSMGDYFTKFSNNSKAMEENMEFAQSHVQNEINIHESLVSVGLGENTFGGSTLLKSLIVEQKFSGKGSGLVLNEWHIMMIIVEFVRKGTRTWSENKRAEEKKGYFILGSILRTWMYFWHHTQHPGFQRSARMICIIMIVK